MIVESITVFASGFMPIFRRDYAPTKANNAELFFKASSEFFGENMMSGSLEVGSSTLWFRKHGDKGLLVVTREGDASMLVNVLDRNLLFALDRVLRDEKTLRRLIDRLVIAALGIETYVKSFMPSLKAVAAVAYRNHKTKMLVGEDLGRLPYLPKDRKDVVVRFEDKHCVIAIPLSHGYLVIKCDQESLDVINEVVEVLRFDYPEVLLAGDDLALYKKLREAYSIVYPDKPGLLLADVDSLLRRNLSVSEAVRTIAYAYGVEAP